MHSQEPWQSRSPTGDVNKSMNSTTLKETGRRGSNHSYGRGLPVKRNALIILTVAILAFAMIPALGAGAATADVKIVTPHELANPSASNTGTPFERVGGSPYVSDVTGQADMADTYGTLYAVIEDNDNTTNKLTTYTAYFGEVSGTGATEAFDVAGAEADTNTTPSRADPVVHTGGHKVAIPTATPVVSSTFLIADRDKNGSVGSEDVTVYLVRQPTGGTGAPRVEQLRASFVRDAVNSTVTIDLTTRGQTSNPTGFGDPEIRIEFTTAAANTVTAEVRSAAGDSITIDAMEKNLTYYATTPNDGITASEFIDPGAVSVDSGTFVGSFGLIPNPWKEMINEWATDASGDDKTVNERTDAVNIDPANAGGDATADPPVTATPVARAMVIDIPAGELIAKGGDRKVDHNDVTATFTTLSGVTRADNNAATAEVAIEPTTGVTVAITKLSARSATVAGLGTDYCATGVTAASDLGANQRLACVEITGATRAGLDNVVNPSGTEIEAADDSSVMLRPVFATAQFDKVTFAFTTESNTQALADAVAETEAADMHEAFEDLGDGRSGLTNALTNQARNLGITIGTTVPASDLVGRLLGVEDKGIVEVRYSDPSPRGVQRATATVDLAAPTVGGFDPAKGSFTTQDSFEVLFTVTDTGAGIPEDAEDTDENTVGNTDRALVAVRVSVGDGGTVDEAAGDDTPDVSQTKEDVTDGYQYETDVDVSRNANNTDNINVSVTVTAYDLAGNSDDVTASYIIDTKDPALLGALTGVGAKLNNKLARDTKADPTLGAYEVVENDPTWIALVFDDAINGELLDAAEVIIAGEVVESLLWLDGSGANVVTTEGKAKNRETITEDNGAGLDLDSSGLAQDARHVLFVKLAAGMDTSSRPAVEIDASDLEDLAGNQDRTDHTIARAHDRLSPVLTVTVVNPLSNDSLDVNIESSEDLRRIPSAAITKVGDNPTDRSLAVKRVGSGWAVEAKAKAIGQTTGGVRTISVSAEDEDGNSITKTAKWELDVEANGGDAPERVGEDDSTKAHGIETNPVTFLSLKFAGEENEYDDDSKKTIDITGVSLETLSAGSIKTDGTIKAAADIEVTNTAEVDAAAIQSSNQITHVVALSELALGNYRLQVNYSDVAGNTGKFGYVFKINPPSPATVDLVPGWSLVSIPGTPQDKSIGGVLEGTSVTDVWSLSNETKVWEFARKDENGEWMGTLSQMVDGRAYFVRSTTFDDIKVLTERFSPQRTPSQYTVTAGWNGIGYTPAGDETSVSVDAYLSSLGASGWGMIRAWDADGTPPQYETYFSSGAMTDGFDTVDDVAVVMEGQGYLLFATRNGVIGG